MRNLLLLPLLLAACGGGGSEPSLQTAALTGAVYEVDGQTVDRSGIQVRVVETGGMIVTGADGSFAFPRVPAGALTLEFAPVALRALAHGGDEDDDDDDDDRDDNEDRDDDDDRDEDDDGNPRVLHVRGGDRVHVRVALRDGEVVEFSARDDDEREARVRMTVAAGSPRPELQGKIKVESEPGEEEFEVEVERLAPGDVVEIFVDDGNGFVRAGVATANAFGEAELELETDDGDPLPFGVATVAELAGFAVEVRLPSGETLLTGTVPALPAFGGDGDDRGDDGDRRRGRARLVPERAPYDGHVDLRSRPEDGDERLTIEAEHLLAGEVVTFQIENPDASGAFVTVATIAANAEGGAEAEFGRDGTPLPFGRTFAREFVGLRVRVLLDGALILSGVVPPLVVD